MGREDEGRAALLQPVQPVPQLVPCLRVQAGRRLVQEQEVGLVDERAGDRDPSFHAAGQWLHRGLRAIRQLDEFEKLVRATAGLAIGQSEIAAVDHQVLADAELRVERILLRDNADPSADPRTVPARVHAEDLQRAVADGRHAADHPHR